MSYTVKSSEKTRKSGAETETKALLYLMNLRKDSEEIMYTYLVCLTDDVQLNLQAEEVVDAKWLEISELENMREDIVNSVWDRYLQFREKIIL